MGIIFLFILLLFLIECMEGMCAKIPSVEVRGQLASVRFLPLCNSGNGTQNIRLGSCAG